MSSHQNLTPGELYLLAGYPDKSKLDAIGLFKPDSIPKYLDAKINPGYSCIFNWSTMQYVFISASVKNILGYNREIFMEKGFGFTLSIIHSQDVQKLRAVHSAIFNYYYNVPSAQRDKLRFSYNLRLKTTANDYIHILRQSTFMEFTEDGKPAIEYVNCTDITGFQYDQTINLSIHRLLKSGTYQLCYEQKFSETLVKLSDREKQVLELVRLGHTTKEIASRMNLAIETVKSHRKHIIAKTGACNMTDAINRVITSHTAIS